MTPTTIIGFDVDGELVDGAHAKRGHGVIELLARTASKGEALVGLARGALADLGHR